MNSDTIEQRFEQLEEKLAYQEMTNAELSEEIFRQQKEIDTLTLAHQSMVQRMEAFHRGSHLIPGINCKLCFCVIYVTQFS